MSLTEFGAIEKYFAGLTPGGHGVVLGVGDDAAVLAVDADSHLVVTTDSLVSGVHFFPDADPCRHRLQGAGRKPQRHGRHGGHAALDYPGADPVGGPDDPCLVGRVRPRPGAIGQEITNVSLVGGDLCKGPLSVTIQVIGVLPERRGNSTGWRKSG